MIMPPFPLGCLRHAGVQRRAVTLCDVMEFFDLLSLNALPIPLYNPIQQDFLHSPLPCLPEMTINVSSCFLVLTRPILAMEPTCGLELILQISDSRRHLHSIEGRPSL